MTTAAATGTAIISQRRRTFGGQGAFAGAALRTSRWTFHQRAGESAISSALALSRAASRAICRINLSNSWSFIARNLKLCRGEDAPRRRAVSRFYKPFGRNSAIFRCAILRNSLEAVNKGFEQDRDN